MWKCTNPDCGKTNFDDLLAACRFCKTKRATAELEPPQISPTRPHAVKTPEVRTPQLASPQVAKVSGPEVTTPKVTTPQMPATQPATPVLPSPQLKSAPIDKPTVVPVSKAPQQPVTSPPSKDLAQPAQSPSKPGPSTATNTAAKTTPSEPSGDDLEPNKSSAVPQEQMDGFIEQMLSHEAEVGFPVFSVTDCNSFHTSGYLWVRYAAKMVLNKRWDPGPTAIVNFDQHADTGKGDSPFVASDRWGAKIVPALKALGFPACYVSVFNGSTGAMGTGLYARDGSAKNLETKPPGLSADNKASAGFWMEIEKLIGPIKYVFVAIDRDVLKDNFTQWGDGAVGGYKALVEKMDLVLAPLLDRSNGAALPLARGSEGNTVSRRDPARVIGFDVNGLPDHYDLWNKQIAVRTKCDWENGLAGELGAYEDSAKKWFGSDTVSRILLYSGSSPYEYPATPQECNCWDFLWYIAGLRLKNVFGQKEWSYILNEKDKPAFGHGQRSFSFYSRKKFGREFALKVTMAPKVLNEYKAGAKTEMGDAAFKLGSFSCTAAVTNQFTAKTLGMPEKVSVAEMKSKTGAFK
jgi:hypothetical protein